MQKWTELPFFQNEYPLLEAFLKSDSRKKILPAEGDELNALKFSPWNEIKVVILGQDPYPNRRHAHGLAFSIPEECPDIPKSLKNILKELESDLGIKKSDGSLIGWAKQGVLLLNTVLTVVESQSNSHKGKGWEVLTKQIIEKINSAKKHIVFILWGNFAQKMGKNVDSTRHLVVKSPHPSPLSSYRGFFGSKPFSKTNNYLKQHGIKPINWDS
jgi:uracil-DNA glycosylase